MEGLHHDKIESLARDIYGLVWANRHDEADKRLRGLGPDLVPVAHALVNGNFRWPPLLLRLGKAGQWLMLFGPVLVPIIYSIFWKLPPVYSGYKWAFYFLLAGGSVVTELSSALFFPWLVNQFGFVKKREVANQRKLDIACVALADCSLTHSDLAAAILDAMEACNCSYREPSTPVDVRLEAALSIALANCTSEMLDTLTQTQRLVLYYKLRSVCDRLEQDEPCFQDNVDIAAALGVSIIRSYLHLPAVDSIPNVKCIAKHDPSVIDPRWASLVQCAAELLPQLEDNYRRFQGIDVLLRSSAPIGTEPTLLRASSEPSDTPAEELLRAVE